MVACRCWACTAAATVIRLSRLDEAGARSGAPAALPMARERCASPGGPVRSLGTSRGSAPPGDQAALAAATGCRPCSAPQDGQTEFVPEHPVLREAVRRRTGFGSASPVSCSKCWRPPCSSRRSSARRPGGPGAPAAAFGEPAPGPAPRRPAGAARAADLGAIPSWEWHKAGVEAVRARTIAAAAGWPAGWRRSSRLPSGRGRPQAAVAARHRAVDVSRGQAARLRRRRCGLGRRLSPARRWSAARWPAGPSTTRACSEPLAPARLLRPVPGHPAGRS